MQNKALIALLSLLLLSAAGLSAEMSGASFLKEEQGARALALGSAATALADDINSLSANPGGLNFFVSPEASAMYTKGLLDSYYSYLAYVQPYGKLGTFSASFLLYNGGSIDITGSSGTSTINAETDMALSFGYGINIIDSLGCGAAVKFITSTLAQDYHALAAAVDLGLLYKPFDGKFTAGLAFQNIGTRLVYISQGDALPFTVRGGASFLVRESGTESWLVAGDLVYLDSSLRYDLGVEAVLFKLLALRVGYKFNNNPDVFTFGAGFEIFQARIDYAYCPTGELDYTQRLSIGFKFDSPSPFKAALEYYRKGMKEKALYILKGIPKTSSEYGAAQAFIKLRD